VVGEIQNAGSQNTELNKITATFFDLEGAPVATASNYSYLDILEPGQTSPFEIVFPSPPPVDNYKLEATWENTTRKPYLSIKVRDTSFRTDQAGWGHLAGEIVNAGNAAADMVIVVGTFYDGGGKVVGTSFTFSEIAPLGTGDSSPFTIIVDPQVVRLMETYSIRAVGSRK